MSQMYNVFARHSRKSADLISLCTKGGMLSVAWDCCVSSMVLSPSHQASENGIILPLWDSIQASQHKACWTTLLFRKYRRNWSFDKCNDYKDVKMIKRIE